MLKTVFHCCLKDSFFFKVCFSSNSSLSYFLNMNSLLNIVTDVKLACKFFAKRLNCQRSLPVLVSLLYILFSLIKANVSCNNQPTLIQERFISNSFKYSEINVGESYMDVCIPCLSVCTCACLLVCSMLMHVSMNECVFELFIRLKCSSGKQCNAPQKKKKHSQHVYVQNMHPFRGVK